jgi:adenylylsulfate kinase-like enzyme
MVIWVTGLSGAGKTTVCRLLYERLKPAVPELVLLDGDAIRESLSTDLGFDEPDRVRQITRVQRLAKLLSDQHLIVLVAVVYANPDLLEWNRTHNPLYLEVLMDTSLDVVQRRDPKGLYGRIARGETRDVVGIDIPWNPPTRPDLVIDPDRCPTPPAAAAAIARAVPRLADAWSALHA